MPSVRFTLSINNLVRTLVERRELTLASSVVLSLRKYETQPSTLTAKELTLLVENARATINRKKECLICSVSLPSSSTSS